MDIDVSCMSLNSPLIMQVESEKKQKHEKKEKPEKKKHKHHHSKSEKEKHSSKVHSDSENTSKGEETPSRCLSKGPTYLFATRQSILLTQN